MHVFNFPDRTKIIDDTYNANPQSMAAALKTIGGMSGRKIAVLGSMLELGSRSAAAHRQTIALARKQKINHIFTYGSFWPRSINHYSDKSRLIKMLKKLIQPRDIILIKGSRGMKMEEVVEALN